MSVEQPKTTGDFVRSLVAAREAADRVPEHDLAFALDMQHASDPQGGENRSDFLTCRMQSTDTWAVCERGAANTGAGYSKS